MPRWRLKSAPIVSERLWRSAWKKKDVVLVPRQRLQNEVLQSSASGRGREGSELVETIANGVPSQDADRENDVADLADQEKDAAGCRVLRHGEKMHERVGEDDG